MAPIALSLDVTKALPATLTQDRPVSIAAWLFLPTADRFPKPETLVVCLPGGSYDKRYYHMEIPGHPGYSMAEHLAAEGHIVLACDPLAVSQSSKPANMSAMTKEDAAVANDAAARTVARRLESGAIDGIPATGPLRLIGVGHSMGGMLTILQQFRRGTYERIAVLGYTAKGVETGMGLTLSQLSDDDDHFRHLRRSLYRSFFHFDDVPAAVIAEDETTGVPVPKCLSFASVSPGIIRKEAAEIRVPLLLGLGERDASPDPHGEPALFGASPDITLVMVPRSGHCHNFASTRRRLWDRIDSWIRDPVVSDSIGRSRIGPDTGLRDGAKVA